MDKTPRQAMLTLLEAWIDVIQTNPSASMAPPLETVAQNCPVSLHQSRGLLLAPKVTRTPNQLQTLPIAPPLCAFLLVLSHVIVEGQQLRVTPVRFLRFTLTLERSLRLKPLIEEFAIFKRLTEVLTVFKPLTEVIAVCKPLTEVVAICQSGGLMD
jgi:hypothetical protein